MQTLRATWPARSLTRHTLIAIHSLSSESFVVRSWINEVDGARNNFSMLVYGNGGGRVPTMCIYAIIVSWPAGLRMQCVHAQSPRNVLCIAEISK